MRDEIGRLRYLTDHPHGYKLEGPEDSRYVSDAQLGRHFLWRVEAWEKRWPHRAKELAIGALNLIRGFAPKPDLTMIAQQHRWEFLERLRRLPDRYKT